MDRFFPAIGAIVFAAILMPAASASIGSVEYSGQCKSFDIMFESSDISGCWDAKIDAPGRVMDPRSGEWKSSFYYVEGFVCGNGSATMRLELDSSAPEVQAVLRLRQNSTVAEKDFVIRQDCPQPLPEEWVLIVASIVIVFFGYVIAWWWKRK